MSGPQIIVNGVTYRSPEEMPKEARAIWDHHVHQMEQQGIDWREQNRIDLTWSREGNVARESIKVERWSVDAGSSPRRIGIETPPLMEWARRHHGPRYTLSRLARDVFIICWLGLFMYGMVSNDYGLSQGEVLLVRAPGSVLLYIAYVLFLAPCLFMVAAGANLSRRTKGPASAADGFFKRFDGFSAAQVGGGSGWRVAPFPLALLFMTYVTTFGGMAKLLHYATRTPGEVTATISNTSTYPGKSSRCIPRLELQEFHFLDDEVCIDYGLLNLVQVGDRVRITGKVSAYAVEPRKIERVAAESGV